MIFPPAAIPIAILLNGAPLRSYNRAYLRGGRVEAPIAPYVTRVADRIAYSGGFMIVSRGSHHVRVWARAQDPRSLQASYVAIAPLLRGLGATLTFDSRRRVLDIRLREKMLQTIPPYQTPQATPTTVFTPEPIVTPRPVFTGVPRPRRTPIIVTTSRP